MMIWRWGIFVWIAATMTASLLWAPLVPVLGETTRVLYFHIPAAWVTVLALGWSMIHSALYLWKRDLHHDDHAAAAAELGLLFCIGATVSGSLWAKSMWGSYWNWDPRESAIVVALLFYAAYLALRQAIADDDARGRLSAAYAVLGLAVSPFLYFVLPRLGFSLHPEPVINSQGKMEVEAKMLTVLLSSSAGFTVLFYRLLSLRCRVAALAAGRLEKQLEQGLEEAS